MRNERKGAACLEPVFFHVDVLEHVCLVHVVHLDNFLGGVEVSGLGEFLGELHGPLGAQVGGVAHVQQRVLLGLVHNLFDAPVGLFLQPRIHRLRRLTRALEVGVHDVSVEVFVDDLAELVVDGEVRVDEDPVRVVHLC